MMTQQHSSLPNSCKVYTPPDLANAVVNALGDIRTFKWLEPCFGQGVFLRALSDLGVGKQRVHAVELDSAPTTADYLAVAERGTDFLAWSAKTPMRFDRIVGNPPYLSIGKLPVDLQATALEVQTPGGEGLTLRTNCWQAFLCASIALLRQGGALGFVLPASWDYANYAKELKMQMTGLFARLETHRSKRPLFDSVSDGSVVVIASGYRLGVSEWQRHEHDDRNSLVEALSDPPRRRRLMEGRLTSLHSKKSTTQRRLGDILKIRIGAVTGDNSYFLLSELERMDHGLPTSSLVPVVTRARHLAKSEITRETWRKLRDEKERVWLFRPSDKDLLNPEVRAYLDLQYEHGGCNRNRFKIRNRVPWYRTNLHPECDAFVSGMVSVGPWLCMRAMDGLCATNTLYTANFMGTLTTEERFAWALSFIAQTREIVQCAGRTYPDGLLKFEPKDIEALLINEPVRVKGAREAYAQAVSKLLCGDSEGAEALAGQWSAA